MNVLPMTPEALVDALDKLYPAKPPALVDSDREVWFKAGQRDVVERLLLVRANGERRQLENG